MRPLALPLLLACACTRTFAPPQPERPGTVSGTVLYQQAGAGDLVPAAGAVLRLLDGTASTTARADGSFLLEGIRSRSAVLLVAFDADGDGAPDRERVLHLAEFGGGPSRDISLGQVVVSRTASIEGHVRRADAPNAPGGNAGSVVFVPQGPFTTTTADDGSFRLANLPEGRLSLSVFRAGYQSADVGEVDLRSGEKLSLEDVVLQPAVGPQPPGVLAGSVALDPAGDLAQTHAVATDLEGVSASASASASGDFRMEGLAPGLYSLMLSHDDYAGTQLTNLLVLPGGTLQLPLVTLTRGGVAGFDAGFGPVADAGPAADAGPGRDAGPSQDAGPESSDGGPVVTASVPAAGDGVGSPYFASATFDQDVDPSDLNDGSRFGLTGPSGEVPGRVLYDGLSHTATFIPDVPLGAPNDPPRSVYTLHASGIHSRAFPFPVMGQPLAVPFAVRDPMLRHWAGADTSQDVSFAPGIAWTPGGAVVFGRRNQIQACAGTPNGYVTWAYTLPSGSSGLASTGFNPSCQPDDATGNRPHRAVVVGTSAYVCAYATPTSSVDFALWRSGPSGWTDLTSVSGCNLGTDGSTLYSVEAGSGLQVRALDTQSGTFDAPLVLDTNPAYAPEGAGVGGDASHLYLVAAYGGASGLTVPVYCTDLASGAMTACAHLPPCDGVSGPARVFTYQGAPLVVQGRTEAASHLIRAMIPSQPQDALVDWPVDRTVGGGPLGGSQFDAVLRGRTLFVLTQEGGGIYLQHADVDASPGVWTPDPGPNPADPVSGRQSLNHDPACSADSPSLSQSPDGLWAAWSEDCGGGSFTAQAVRVW